MSNPSVVLSKDTIFVDELIRENARLVIQREADQQLIRDLRERASSEELEQRLAEALMTCDVAKVEANQAAAKLQKAVSALHGVMAGADPCKVCLKKCRMGDSCVPQWVGLEPGGGE